MELGWGLGIKAVLTAATVTQGAPGPPRSRGFFFFGFFFDLLPSLPEFSAS